MASSNKGQIVYSHTLILFVLVVAGFRRHQFSVDARDFGHQFPLVLICIGGP